MMKSERFCVGCSIGAKDDVPQIPEFSKPNARLLEDCRQADKLGISYGVYKASESVWMRRYKLKVREEQNK